MSVSLKQRWNSVGWSKDRNNQQMLLLCEREWAARKHIKAAGRGRLVLGETREVSAAGVIPEMNYFHQWQTRGELWNHVTDSTELPRLRRIEGNSGLIWDGLCLSCLCRKRIHIRSGCLSGPSLQTFAGETLPLQSEDDFPWRVKIQHPDLGKHEIVWTGG